MQSHAQSIKLLCTHTLRAKIRTVGELAMPRAGLRGCVVLVRRGIKNSARGCFDSEPPLAPSDGLKTRYMEIARHRNRAPRTAWHASMPQS
jgi:hypothetical protein